MTRALSKHCCLARGQISMSIRRKGISDFHVRVSPQKVKDSLNRKIRQAVSEKDFLRAHTLQMAFNKRFQE